jgi:PadR family transcriptional regulator, regulatory protein PadR
MAFRSDLEAMILGVLHQAPLHGYEIGKRIRQASKDALKFTEGQLYPTLHKLEHESKVTAEWVPQEGKPPRKIYAITEVGQKELERQKKGWHDFAKGVSAVLGVRMEAEGR